MPQLCVILIEYAAHITWRIRPEYLFSQGGRVAVSSTGTRVCTCLGNSLTVHCTVCCVTCVSSSNISLKQNLFPPRPGLDDGFYKDDRLNMKTNLYDLKENEAE